MTSRVLSAIAVLFRPSRGPARPGSSEDSDVVVEPAFSPGRAGPTATVEVDPARIGSVTMSYVPRPDGDADPGEIVWTWVPYQEQDGRGKDRPVLVVATEPAGTVLAVQLTSQDRQGRPGYIPVGVGGWDDLRRASWVDIHRVFRLHQGGMRREASALDGTRFAAVRAALIHRYGWRSRE